MKNGKSKLNGLLKGLKLFSFGLITCVATATLTYFIAPGEKSDNGPDRIQDNDSFNQTHGDILFSNISGISKLSLKNLVADITLPDGDIDDNTSNRISLSGSVSLSVPSLSNLALNLDTTLTYDGYSPVKAVKKDLDITYLGSSKDLYLSLTDGYFDENGQKKTISYEGNPYTSGIRYCVNGTEYDDLVDTIYTMLKESVRFSDSINDDSSSSSEGTSSLTDLMNTLSISLIEDQDKEYQYTFSLDLGKDGWDPIVLKMSSDEECNLTGIWTEENSPIKIPLSEGKYCVIALNAKEASMVEDTVISAPTDAASYSKLINSTSLMKKVFNIVDKEAFDLDISGNLIHKYGEKEISAEDGTKEKENLHETLSLDGKLSVDYLNNILDFTPTIESHFDEGEAPVRYGLDMALRPSEEDHNKSNLYFTYNANAAALAKLNFTNMKSLNRFLGSLVDSFGNISSNIDLEKINNVINYFTSLVDDGKEVITGKATLKGSGEPSDSLGNVGDTYLNKDNNRKYAKDAEGWKKNELTLIDEIKEGHYQRCFDILKGIYTGDNVISLVLTLEPFGLGENANITLTLQGDDSSTKDLLSIKLSDLEFNDFKIKDFAIKVNEIKSEFLPINEEDFQCVNNMPVMFDEFATLVNSKKAGLTFNGEFRNDIEESSKTLSSLSFSGAAKFDANEGKQGAKISLDMNQEYKNAVSKNVKHDLRLEVGNVSFTNENVTSEGETLTPEEHDYCTKFAYQSKDIDELKGEERGGLYGKGYLSSFTDLLRYLRTLLSDEKVTLRERVINPVQNLVTIVNLGSVNKNIDSETTNSNKRYFAFLQTNYIKSIDNATDGDLETLTLTINGLALNLNSDMTFTMVRYAKDNANHKAGELESFNLVDLSLGENKKLNLSFGVEKYENVIVKDCPLDKENSDDENAISYYDFSSLSTLAKFGINTGLKQDSYYWSGNISVNLGSLKGIIDVNTNVYIKVNCSSFKMMGDFSLPLIPEVNGPTDSAPEALRVAAGLGTRTVEFYYDSNTNYETKSSNSRVYFVGSSDVKGNVFDTNDYASFDINYVLNHASDVFLGYVLDVYPSLLAKDDQQESTTNNEKPSSTEVTLDNEYDSLIKNYYAPEVGDNGSWGISFDFAALLGVMSVRSSSFDFDMNVRHLADLDLLVTTENDILVSFLADIKVYLGIRISIGLVNNSPVAKETNSKVFHSEIADEKFAKDGDFDSYISKHQSDALNTVYSQKKTKLEGQETYSWGDYSIDESWALQA